MVPEMLATHEARKACGWPVMTTVTADSIHNMMRKFKIRGYKAPGGWSGIKPDEITAEYLEVLGRCPEADLTTAIGSWIAAQSSMEEHIHRKIPTPEDLLARMPQVAGQLRAMQGQGLEWWTCLNQELRTNGELQRAFYQHREREGLLSAGFPADVVDTMAYAVHGCSTTVDGEYYTGWNAVRLGGSGQSSSRTAFVQVFNARSKSLAEQGRTLSAIGETVDVLEGARCLRIHMRDQVEAAQRKQLEQRPPSKGITDDQKQRVCGMMGHDWGESGAPDGHRLCSRCCVVEE